MAKYRMFNKYQDSNWMRTTRTADYLETAVRNAHECAKDAIAWGMTAVVEDNTSHKLHIVEFSAGDAGIHYVNPGYEKEVLAALNQEVKKDFIKGCPDCKDGFYYPLVGSKEPCSTCATQTDFSNDSKLIMHLQDVWANHPWGSTKISKPTFIGISFAVNAHVVVKPDTMPEIINDKLVDRVTESMHHYKRTQFYEYKPPIFNIINFPDESREIYVRLTVGFQ